MDMDTAVKLGSVLIGVVGLAATLLVERRKQLRREEVLAWADEAIAALETLLLLCLDELSGRRPATAGRLEPLRLTTAILVERGRLFFRNAHPKRHGAWKQLAYRGFRPCILDDLVIAHQIATEWTGAGEDDRLKMRLVAEDCLKRFVSLVQKEVGRSRTASADTSRGGRGASVSDLMAELDPERAARAAEALRSEREKAASKAGSNRCGIPIADRPAAASAGRFPSRPTRNRNRPAPTDARRNAIVRNVAPPLAIGAVALVACVWARAARRRARARARREARPVK